MNRKLKMDIWWERQQLKRLDILVVCGAISFIGLVGGGFFLVSGVPLMVEAIFDPRLLMLFRVLVGIWFLLGLLIVPLTAYCIYITIFFNWNHNRLMKAKYGDDWSRHE